MTLPWYLGNSRMYGEWGSVGMWGIRGLIVPLIAWSVLWTGLALWHSARRSEKWWFIIFLIVHTAGILELLYLIFVAKAFTSKPHTKHKK